MDNRRPGLSMSAGGPLTFQDSLWMRTFPQSGRVPRAVIRVAAAGIALPGTGAIERVAACREAPVEPLAIILTAAHTN